MLDIIATVCLCCIWTVASPCTGHKHDHNLETGLNTSVWVAVQKHHANQPVAAASTHTEQEHKWDQHFAHKDNHETKEHTSLEAPVEPAEAYEHPSKATAGGS